MYIYLMASADNWHKIGISTDPVQRRSVVGMYSPVKGYTELLAAVKVPPRKAYWIEQYALRRTKGKTMPGAPEWTQASRFRCYRAMLESLRRHGVRKVKKLEFRRSHTRAGWRASARAGRDN